MKLALLAAAVALAAPAAFAQSTTVHSTTITTAPAAVSAAPVTQRPLPGAVIAQGQLMAPAVVASSSDGSSTAVLGAAPAPVTRYWFNVPSNIETRRDFQRWQRLL